MNKYLTEVLQEMFRRVGVNLNETLLENDAWYTTYSWTLAEQKDFENWFVNYLYNNTKARNALCSIPRRSKKHLRKVAQEFIFQYGWSLKE